MKNKIDQKCPVCGENVVLEYKIFQSFADGFRHIYQDECVSETLSHKVVYSGKCSKCGRDIKLICEGLNKEEV